MRRSIVLSFPFQLVFPDETVSYWLHEVVELIRPKFWRHDIQHNDTQHNDTQHNNKKHETQPTKYDIIIYGLHYKSFIWL